MGGMWNCNERNAVLRAHPGKSYLRCLCLREILECASSLHEMERMSMTTASPWEVPVSPRTPQGLPHLDHTQHEEPLLSKVHSRMSQCVTCVSLFLLRSCRDTGCVSPFTWKPDDQRLRTALKAGFWWPLPCMPNSLAT